MFLDKTENEKVNALKEVMRHSIIASDIKGLDQCVKDA